MSILQRMVTFSVVFPPIYIYVNYKQFKLSNTLLCLSLLLLDFVSFFILSFFSPFKVNAL